MKKALVIAAIFLLGLASTINHNLAEFSPQVEFSKITIEDLNDEVKKEISCLARNLYFEARNESDDGIRAVGFVTINRKNSKEFPPTICEVVYERNPRVCQFSWVCEGKKTVKNEEAYDKCMDIAFLLYINGTLGYNKLNDTTEGSLFYHADYVSPDWGRLKMVKQIDTHIFYRI